MVLPFSVHRSKYILCICIVDRPVSLKKPKSRDHRIYTRCCATLGSSTFLKLQLYACAPRKQQNEALGPSAQGRVLSLLTFNIQHDAKENLVESTDKYQSNPASQTTKDGIQKLQYLSHTIRLPSVAHPSHNQTPWSIFDAERTTRSSLKLICRSSSVIRESSQFV